MIVKDEAMSIRNVLEAAKPHIDGATILDTGSTDDTIALVHESLDGIPHTVIQGQFEGYATSRNAVMKLDAAREDAAEFQLMLSGDEFLAGDEGALREQLEAVRESNIDCFRLRLLLDDTTIMTPRIFRTGSAWQYVSKLPLELHEYPEHPEGANAGSGNIERMLIEHVVSNPEKRLGNVWEVHVPKLREHIEENPDDARGLIFLAGSLETFVPYMKGGEKVSVAMEIMSLYLRRLSLPFETEAERNFMRMRYLENARYTGVYSDEELLSRALELAKDDPQRPETALLATQAALKVKNLPMMKAYELATQATKVAAEASRLDNSSPVSVACGWKAHHIAAQLMRNFAKKHPNKDTGGGITFADRAQQHVEEGLKAGGPWVAFRGLAEDAQNAESTS